MSGFVTPSSFFPKTANEILVQNTVTRSTPSIHLFKRRTIFTRVNNTTSLKRVRTIPICSSSSTDFPDLRNKTCKIGVLVSGGGRSLQNICERVKNSKLHGCQVSIVIASKKNAYALERAKNFQIPTRVLSPKSYEQDTERFSNAIAEVMDEFEVDLVVMAGWMHFFHIPSRYSNRVINIHPSLIPSFCGKGYYGHRVHDAVLKFGAKITGCTVHFADNEYDHGPIILQKAVPVVDGDDTETLAARVFDKETEALPEAIQLFVEGRLSFENGVIRVREKTLSFES